MCGLCIIRRKRTCRRIAYHIPGNGSINRCRTVLSAPETVMRTVCPDKPASALLPPKFTPPELPSTFGRSPASAEAPVPALFFSAVATCNAASARITILHCPNAAGKFLTGGWFTFSLSFRKNSNPQKRVAKIQSLLSLQRRDFFVDFLTNF